MTEIVSTKKNALVATTAIFGSRIFGLIREQVFAYFFGASAVLDAFIVAFRIPNLLRDLFAEGALSQSFVSVFSKKIARGEVDDAKRLARNVNGFILLVVGVITIAAIIFAAPLTHLVAAGFEGDKFNLTVLLTRVLFPFILFASLAAITMGILNAHNKYFIPHSASTFFNITSIVLGILFAWIWAPDYMTQLFNGTGASDFLGASNAITGMAIGTLLGGVGQYAFQLPTTAKLGYRPGLSFDFKNPELRQILKLTLPAVIGGAAVQINVLVNTQFASYMNDGAVSYLNYAFRFMQFPLGVFGVAIASATAPQLAKMVAQNKSVEFAATMRTGIKMSLLLCVPSTLGLIVLGPEIIAMIYEHGRFLPTDTLATAQALSAYAVGITAYALIKIYQPAFLAHDDARTAMRVSLFSIVANLVINFTFVNILHLSFWSLALGTAIVAVINFLLLAWLFRHKQREIWDLPLTMSLSKIFAASLVMAASVYFAKPVLAGVLPPHFLGDVILVLGCLILAAVVYGLSCLILRVEEAQILLRRFKR